MYHVFFERRPTRRPTQQPVRPQLPQLPSALYEQLTALLPDTEVNVHTANETYYNALFLGFEPQTNTVSLLVDRFYEDGGHTLTLDATTITAIDLPASMQSSSSTNLDDEVE